MFLKENPLCLHCLEERGLDPALSQAFGAYCSGAISDAMSFDQLKALMKVAQDMEATVVDHIIPHRGNMELFWRRENWQPLCEKHHNVKTAKETL